MPDWSRNGSRKKTNGPFKLDDGPENKFDSGPSYMGSGGQLSDEINGMQFLNIATVPVMTEQFLNTAECESRCNESRADCINQHVSTRLYQKLLILRGRVSKEDAIVMIDSGASRNFLSHALVLKNKIRLDTENKDIIRLADGRNIEGNGTVNSLRYSIGQYTARSNFSVIKLTQGYDMILGKP